MWKFLLPSLFLFSFGFFNLFGIKREFAFFQLVTLIVSLVVFVVVRRIGLLFFRRNASFFYWLFIGLLVFTFIIGFEVRGSKRWIDLYFFNFQPSEFFKPFFALFIADYFARHRKDLEESAIFFRSIFLFILPTFIIFLQPDLGTALVYAAIFIPIFLFSQIPKRYLVFLVVVLALTLPLGWFVLKDYQKERLATFVQPARDIQGSGYNRLQAMITIGSGTLVGRGLGYGTQSKLRFLPENHTDFAYASLVEQFGFIGGITVIFLFFYLTVAFIKKIMKYYRQTDEDGLFKFLFVVGIFSAFVFQVLVNVTMNMGMFPITGITLPFISYGGSSLVSVLLGFALIP